MRISIFRRKGRIAESLPQWGFWFDHVKGMFASNIYLGPVVINIDFVR